MHDFTPSMTEKTVFITIPRMICFLRFKDFGTLTKYSFIILAVSYSLFMSFSSTKVIFNNWHFVTKKWFDTFPEKFIV